jgi:HK97 family phage major capsid protein
MKKELFTKYLQDELEAKKNLLVKNELSDEDKAAVQNSIDNLTDILEKVEQSEDEEGLMELKNTVNDLNEKLTAIEEKIQQNKTEVNKDKMDTQEYLKSQNSLHDFADAIRNARNANEFRKNWNDKLVANGFTITEGSESAFIPEAVKGQINDIWDRNADWLVSLTNTGAKRFYCRYNTSDQTAENSRAKGWKKGTEKSVQSINFASKLLEAQFVYKIQSIDLQTRFESDEALITYILNELVDQILYEIKRAILVGDGRDASSNYKISKLEAIAKASTDDYTTVSTVTANGFLVDDVRAMVDSIKNDNNKPVLVFMDKTSLRTLSRVQASETSTPVYIPTEQVAEQIGATRIITTDLLGANYKALAFIPSEYYLVGENILNPVLYTWHEGYKNVDVWRYECVAGGGINAMQSSAVLKAE